MKQFIDKLISRLEEEKQRLRNLKNNCVALSDHEVIAIEEGAYNFCKNIVNELAEEYNNGWIPCSERLPKDDSICIVTVEYPNNETVVDYGWFDRKGVCWFVGVQEFRTSNILAWQSLPAPYKKGE